jgi:predicted dehydrogenase
MDTTENSSYSRRDFVKTAAKGAAVATVAMTGFPTIVPSSVFGKNAPSNMINVGQIGCGRIATVHDLKTTLKYTDAARVIAIADFDGVRQDMGKKYILDTYEKSTGKPNFVDVKLYDHYRDLLANKDIDAVQISTPDHWHAQVAIEAAQAGKHIYCQKPTSLTIEEGRTMSDMISKTGVVFQLGSQQRSMDPWPQFKKACELVRNGHIGELKTVRIGLPGDPSGGVTTEMPIPERFNYDAWLGSTPYVYYTYDRVADQHKVATTRPGWLRMEQFGAGMITGWGVHHIDIAHWGMNTEHTGPIEAECVHVEFPKAGLWNVHGPFEVHMKYANGVEMVINDTYQNGIRFEGTKGWVFCARTPDRVTSTDPTSNVGPNSFFTASDPKLLTRVTGPNEIQLYNSPEQHRNWLDCIKNKKPNISPIEVAHRSCSACLVAHASMKFKSKLHFDPAKEHFIGNAEANKLLSRPQRYPYGTSYIGKVNS